MNDQYQTKKQQAREHLLKKDYIKSISLYEQCLEIAQKPEITLRELAIINLNIGICYINRELYHNSLKYIDQAIELDPTYFKSYYRKAQTLMHLKEYQEALQIVKQLLSKEPCKEVYDLQQLIQETMLKNSNKYIFSQIKEDFDNSSSDKDILKIFSTLYNRPEDLEAQQEIFETDYGFCKELINYAIQSEKEIIIYQTIKYIQYLWNSIKKVLQERKLFIPYWLTQLLIENNSVFLESQQKKAELTVSFWNLLAQSNLYTKQVSQIYSYLFSKVFLQLANLIQKNEKFTYLFLEKNLLDTSRLFILNQKFVQNCKKEEIQSILFGQEQNKENGNLLQKCMKKLIEFIGAKMKNIGKYENDDKDDDNEDNDDEDEFDTECEEAHLLWEIIISCFKISDSVNEKVCSNQNDIYAFDFFLRDYFRKKDLIILIGMAGANFSKFIEKAQYHKLQDKALLTVIKKQKKLRSIDLIKQLLSLVLKVDELNTKLSQSVYIDKVNSDLQGYLREYKYKDASTINFKYNVKFLCLLFQVNSKAKFLQLYEYLILIDCETFLYKIFQSESIFVQDALILLRFITTFDDAKKIIIKAPLYAKNFVARIKQYIDDLQKSTEKQSASTIKKIQIYSCTSSLIQFLLALCIDQSKDYREEQKERFGIDDEQYKMAKELENKYKGQNNEKVVDSDQYFKYDEKFIAKYEVLQFVGLKLQGIKIVSDFLNHYEELLTDQAKTAIAQLLARLSQDDSLVQYLFDKRSLRLVAGLCVKGYKNISDGHTYLSKVMCNANPNLFEYKDVHMLLEALLQSAQTSKHELQIFQSLLGIVQLTSLGDDVAYRLSNQKSLLTIQNFLMEENNYICHASIQILNNISLCPKFIETIKELKAESNFYKILNAVIQFQHERLLKYFLGKKLNEQFDQEKLVGPTDFSHPLNVFKSILSFCAVLSHYIEVHVPLLQNEEIYVHLAVILKEQDIKTKTDILHKIACLWQNQKLKKLVKELHDSYMKLNEQVQSQKDVDGVLKEKLQLIDEVIRNL